MQGVAAQPCAQPDRPKAALWVSCAVAPAGRLANALGISIVKRAASEKLRTLRVWRRHLASHDHKIACRCEFQTGRFRKGQRIGGCGRARCWLCHYDKLSKLATLQERRAAATLYEGLSEIECLNSPSPQMRVTAFRYNKAVGCSSISDRKQASATI